MDLNTYEDWYSWALQRFGGDADRARLAARAAIEAQSVGAAPEAMERAATRAASAATGSLSPVAVPTPGPPTPAPPAAAPPPQSLTPFPGSPVMPPAQYVAQPQPFPPPQTAPPPPPAGVTPPPLFPEPGPPGARPPVARAEWQDPRVYVGAGALILLLLVGGFVVVQRAVGSLGSNVSSRTSPAPLASPSPKPSATIAGCPEGKLKYAAAPGCYTPGPAVGPPAPIAGVKMIYYDIAGSSDADLTREMSQKAPRCIVSEAPIPGTSWCTATTRIPGNVIVNQTVNGSCTVTNAYVSYTAEVTVPRWNPGPGTPPELVASWNRFLHGLYAYQQGYYDIIVRIMQAVPGRVIGHHCLDDAALQALNAQITGEFNDKARAYVQDTKLGATLIPSFP